MMTKLPLCALAVGVMLITGPVAQAGDMKMSHAHMGHVLTSWNGTPNNAGLMTTAMDEATIALQHATAATKKTDDLGWMQMHTAHVVHAVDPTKVDKGPGLGYGLIKASQGVAKHIGAAAASGDASGNIKTHAVHVAASANNAVARASSILRLADDVKGATSAKEAAVFVMDIKALSSQIIEGVDANGDGKITWHEGEGGLNQSLKHANIMAKGEGL
ncbi:MAG: hypothetical protein V7677_13430 [Motiliproteus sp.]